MKFLKKYEHFFIGWSVLSIIVFFADENKTIDHAVVSVLSGFITAGIIVGICHFLEKPQKSDDNNVSSTDYKTLKEKYEADKQADESNHTVYTSPKNKYKENKKAGIVSCPKCGSSSITSSNKKLSVKRGATGAIIGGVLTGGIGAGVGAVAGGLTSKKVYNVCMNCGHKWKP